MNRQPFERPPRWWPPRLSPKWICLWRILRRRQQVGVQKLLDVAVHGAQHIRDAVAQNFGVLITPNHSSHADCFAIYGASDEIGVAFHIMVAWQVFQRSGWLRRLAMQHHGCFSVDREGTDMHMPPGRRHIGESPAAPRRFPGGRSLSCQRADYPFSGRTGIDGPSGRAQGQSPHCLHSLRHPLPLS